MSTDPVPKIAVSGVEKSFGAKRVLVGVEIGCAAGESLVIIGGSGGKSVLIKCTSGCYARCRVDCIDGRKPRPGRAARKS
jgi:ABC-type transporter Mla maintaining outer membrane lipid asymmetry ATPase subunit MlaF